MKKVRTALLQELREEEDDNVVADDEEAHSKGSRGRAVRARLAFCTFQRKESSCTTVCNHLD